VNIACTNKESSPLAKQPSGKGVRSITFVVAL